MAIASIVCDRFLFWDRVCAIGEFISDNPVYKSQRGVIMSTNFGTKIPINAFLWEIRRMWLLITGFSSLANPKKTFLIARVYGTLPWQPNGLCYWGIHLWHCLQKGQRCYTNLICIALIISACKGACTDVTRIQTQNDFCCFLSVTFVTLH